MVASVSFSAAFRRLSMGTLLLAFLASCGPSQEQFDAKVRENEDLKARFAAEAAAHKNAQKLLADAGTQIEQLKAQLAAAGLDLTNLNATVDDQARALDDYRRRAEQLEAIRQRFEVLRRKLDELTKFGLKVQIRKNRIVIQLPGDVLFDSGADTLRKEGKEILVKVAKVIRDDAGLMSRTYQVAGHTDSKPFKGIFKDNWGLSAMRAREVLVYLTETESKGGGGLKPDLWAAVGYGDTDPVADNGTEEGRKGNRRVELVVMPNVEEMIDLKAITK